MFLGVMPTMFSTQTAFTSMQTVTGISRNASRGAGAIYAPSEEDKLKHKAEYSENYNGDYTFFGMGEEEKE